MPLIYDPVDHSMTPPTSSHLPPLQSISLVLVMVRTISQDTFFFLVIFNEWTMMEFFQISEYHLFRSFV